MRIQNITYSNNTYSKKQLNFQGLYLPEKFYKKAEKATNKIELSSRIIANKVSNLALITYYKAINIFAKIAKKPPKQLPKVDIEAINQLDTSTTEYKKFLYVLQREMTGGKEVEINYHDSKIQEIAESDEACIFIMNHDKQRQDPKLLNFFNAILTIAYNNHKKLDTCPIPKVILNKDIVDTFKADKKSLAEKWGAVGVDASIHCTNHLYNGRVIANLIRDFANDKINIFIFPEGKMCAFKNMSPDWKFQSGIADIIKRLTDKKEQVKVVPLGFAYNKIFEILYKKKANRLGLIRMQDTGGIHIGEPIYFRKEKDSIQFTAGTIDKRYQAKEFTDFIETAEKSSDGFYTITTNGDTVSAKDTSQYIAGILCENLVACKKQAADSIKNVGTIDDAKEILML